MSKTRNLPFPTKFQSDWCQMFGCSCHHTPSSNGGPREKNMVKLFPKKLNSGIYVPFIDLVTTLKHAKFTPAILRQTDESQKIIKVPTLSRYRGNRRAMAADDTFDTSEGFKMTQFPAAIAPIRGYNTI